MPPTLAVTLALEPTPVARAGHAPVGEHVVGEGLVVGHHVEVGVDGGAGLGDVDGDGDGLGRSHDVPHGTLSEPMAGKDPRGRLLEAAIDHIAARGVTDLSLRELAAAIGTSHRMLIHHFGSREGLWVEVIRAVEERQRDALAEVVPDPGAERRRRDAPVVAAHLRPVAVAQRAAVLRALRPGAAGPAGDGRAARRDRRRVARAGGRGASSRSGSRARRRSRRRGSASRSAAGCCSTCSRPATATAVDAAMEAYIALIEARLDGKPGHVLTNPD